MSIRRTWSTSGTATAATSVAGVAAGVRPIWVDRWATDLPVPDGVVRITDLTALPAVLA